MRRIVFRIYPSFPVENTSLLASLTSTLPKLSSLAYSLPESPGENITFLNLLLRKLRWFPWSKHRNSKLQNMPLEVFHQPKYTSYFIPLCLHTYKSSVPAKLRSSPLSQHSQEFLISAPRSCLLSYWKLLFFYTSYKPGCNPPSSMTQ